MLDLLEAYKIYAAVVAMLLAVADAYTSWRVITSGKGIEREFWKGTNIVWVPAKLIEAVGLIPYLVATRVIVAGCLWLEPAAGYPLAVLFGVVTVNNVRNMKR